MRIALVSSFPPAECGIGNYTQQLVTALTARSPDLQLTVLAERAPGATEAPSVRRSWHRTGPWDLELMDAIDATRPDVVHIQHEETFFGEGSAIRGFVRGLHERRIAAVVTLHTVYATRRGRAFQRQLVADGAHLVVHQRTGMADVLADHGIAPDRIAVIAHGTPRLARPDRASARIALGLPAEVPIALFFGFIHRTKGLHVAVAAFERLARDDRRCLVIVGQVRRRWFHDAIYAAGLRRQLRAGIAAGRIIFRPGFAAREDVASYFAAADLVVLPYRQRYGSASGVLHDTLAAGRAFVCTRGLKFAEAVEHLGAELPEAFPRAGNVGEWEHGLEQLLSSAARRTRMSELVAQLAETTSWTASAERHTALYAAAHAAR